MSNYKSSDQSPEGKNNRKKRNTALLAASVLAVAALLEGIRIFAGAGAPAAAGGPAGAAGSPRMSAYHVSVSVDGKESAVYSLSDTVDTRIEGYQGGFNHLVVSDGKAVFTEADCPDGRCTRMGPVSEPGEWIVCLPHRVTVTVR